MSRKQVGIILEGQTFNSIKEAADYIKTDSNRVYCSITVNKKIPQSDKSKVLSQINKNKFHVEIQNDKNTKTIIEIHNKELDMNHLLELSRGETNNV